MEKRKHIVGSAPCLDSQIETNSLSNDMIRMVLELDGKVKTRECKQAEFNKVILNDWYRFGFESEFGE
jgi:hypothetical protein